MTVVNLQKIRYYFREKKVKVVLALIYHLSYHVQSLIRARAGRKYLKEMKEKK